jgi:hypothetical protein
MLRWSTLSVVPESLRPDGIKLTDADCLKYLINLLGVRSAAVLRGISPEHWAQLGPTGTQLSSQDMAHPLHFGTADTDMGRNITAGDPQWYHWVLHAAKRC